MPERPAEAVPEPRLLLALARLLGDGEAALQVLHRTAQVAAAVLQATQVLVGLQFVRTICILSCVRCSVCTVRRTGPNFRTGQRPVKTGPRLVLIPIYLMTIK